MFGLINANARLYSPYLGRFVSPDPLLNSEGGPLDYNPYVYARNNPYKYIDRNGEFPWLIVAFAAFTTAGGVANVVSNWSDIHSVLEGAGYFFLGAGVTGAAIAGAAVLGTAAAYAAPYIAGVLGVAAESAVALGTAYAAAGAVYYVYEGCLNSAVYGTPFEFSWNGLAKSMLTWGIPAGTAGYWLAKAKGLDGWTGLEKSSNVMATHRRPLMKNPDAMAAMSKADKKVPEYASSEVSITEETTYELPGGSYVNSSNIAERNATMVTRDFTGYSDRIVPRDGHHDFPFMFDKEIIQHGTIRSTDVNTGFVYPGFRNGKPGYYNITISNQDRVIFHREFRPFEERFKLYVKDGNGNKHHFFFPE